MENFKIMEGVKPEDIWYQNNHMPGYKEIGYNIIFDIKMDGKLTRTETLVTNVHETEYVPN